MTVTRYIVVLAAGIFIGLLLADLWKAPYHGLQVTVSGAVAAAIALAYLLWTKRTANPRP